jgi:hypothetical protein
MSAVPIPLTVNKLNGHDKSRLIRSTKKLEAILGTTPHFTESESFRITLPRIDPPPSPRTKASRRHGSIFTIFPIIPPSGNMSLYSTSTNSSLSSLTLMPEQEPAPSVEVLSARKSFSSKARRSAEAPRPLVLCINTVPVQACDSRIPLSPMSPVICSTGTHEPMVSPIFPDFPCKPSEEKIRLKRMAKLNRTFGERVPPECVFPSIRDTLNISSPVSQGRHLSESVRPLPPSTATHQASGVWKTGSDTDSWSGEWNRKDIGEVQHKLRTLRAK